MLLGLLREQRQEEKVVEEHANLPRARALQLIAQASSIIFTSALQAILPIYRPQGINRVKDLEEFFEYQRQSVAGDLDWEADFEAAHEVVRDLRWDLELLRDKSDGADPIKELIKAGVKLGVARRLWKDSKKWANERRTQLEGSFQDIDN